jgi:hypothetical protein
MRAGLSFSRSPISLLLRQPLSIKKSYAGAIQVPSKSNMQKNLLFKFWGGSGSADPRLELMDTDLDPDPAIFVIDLSKI